MALPDALAPRTDVAHVAVDGTTVIYDAAERKTHQLNSSAAVVWSLLLQGLTVEDIQEELASAFPEASDTVRNDVESVVELLREAHLLGPPLSPPAAPPPEARIFPGSTMPFPDALRGATHDALGFRFAIEGPGDLVAALDHTLRSLATPGPSGPAEHGYLITDAGGDRVSVWLDERETSVARRAEAGSHLLWHVNQQACNAKHDALLMHASAVLTPSGVVAFAGTMNAGKSTTVMGLLRHGYTYVTDEAVCLSLDELTVTAYPKPIGIDRGSYPLFPDLQASAHPHASNRWWISPLDVPGARVAPNGSVHPLRAVVLVQYDATGPTTVAPVDALTATVELTTNLFNLADHGQAGLDAVARIAREIPCLRMTHASLDDAVDWVEQHFPSAS